MTETIGILLFLAWGFLCPLAAGMAAESRNASFRGTAAGFLFGPLGVIAALGFDNRPMCPRCGGRLNTDLMLRPEICQHCHVALKWHDDSLRLLSSPRIRREVKDDFQPPPRKEPPAPVKFPPDSVPKDFQPTPMSRQR